MRFRALSILVIGLLLFPAAVFHAQNYQGGLRGLVMDTTGAIVANAKVVLTNEGKQTKFNTVSNGEGQYVFTSLEPGSYTVEVTMAGFKNYVQTGIQINAAAVTTQDLKLQLGGVTETVEVSSSAVQLDVSDASMATTFIPAQINDMATLSGPGRSPYTASQLAPTITPNAGQGSGSSDQSNISYVTVAGSPEATNLYLVDGIPITDTTNRPMYIPPIEAIQEQKVQILDYDAEMSRTGGGVFNTVLKSGTNRLHGSLYGVTTQTDWEANSFFNNRNHIARPTIDFFNYAGSIGGPVRIPHVYNGTDKTFFFMSEEGYRNPQTASGTYTVPTAAEKTGDFSQSSYKIYDPTTTQNLAANQTYNCPDGNTYTAPTAGYYRCQAWGVPATGGPAKYNVIPQNELSSVGLNYMTYLPNPNANLSSTTDSNNYVVPPSKGPYQRDDVFVSKLDEQFYPWLHGAGSYTHYGSAQVVYLSPNLNKIASGGTLYARKVDATTFNLVATPNAKTVIAARFGFNRFSQKVFALSYIANFSPSSLGFTGFTPQANFFPTAAFTGTAYSQLGTAAGTNTIWSSRNLVISINESLGRHSLKGGFEYRKMHMDYIDNTDAPSDYVFNGTFTTQNGSAASGTNGNGIADLLYGLPFSGQIEDSQKFFQFMDYFGAFVQDDYRMNTKLTLNLGLRYEYETGLKEKNNNETVGFSQTIANPGAVYDAGLKGGLLYAGVNGKTECCDLAKAKFAPKVGFSYELTQKTVVHGGIGLLWLPMRYDPTAALNIGYTSETPVYDSPDSGKTILPGWTFSKPFPNGITAPTGNSAGLLSGWGTPIQAIQLGFRSPLLTQFSIGLQRTLPWGVLFEGSYIGSRGRHMPTTPQGAGTSTSGGGKTNIDQLNPSFYPNGVPTISGTVPNPFQGKTLNGINLGTGIFSGSTISAIQANLPYPQYQSVSIIPDYSASSYNGMALQVTKHDSGKFDLSANFTWSRNEDGEYGLNSTGPQNAYDLKSEWSQSQLDLPFRYTFNGDYWLPVGHGRMLMGSDNRWLDMAIGGWQVDMTNVIQSGLPMGITQSNQNGPIGTNIQRPNENAGVPIKTGGSKFARITQYVNPAAFTPVGEYLFGNTPRRVSARTFGYVGFDGALQKSFNFGEGIDLMFRAESENFINHANLSAPGSLNISTLSSFGAITASGAGRYIKLGGRLTF